MAILHGLLTTEDERDTSLRNIRNTNPTSRETQNTLTYSTSCIWHSSVTTVTQTRVDDLMIGVRLLPGKNFRCVHKIEQSDSELCQVCLSTSNISAHDIW